MVGAGYVLFAVTIHTLGVTNLLKPVLPTGCAVCYHVCVMMHVKDGQLFLGLDIVPQQQASVCPYLALPLSCIHKTGTLI